MYRTRKDNGINGEKIRKSKKGRGQEKNSKCIKSHMLSTNVAFFVSYLIILRNLNFPQLYCFYHSISNTETLTCPRGSLRNNDEVAPDLAWSEVNVFETNLVITVICHSVKQRRETAIRHRDSQVNEI